MSLPGLSFYCFKVMYVCIGPIVPVFFIIMIDLDSYKHFKSVQRPQMKNTFGKVFVTNLLY